MHLDAAARPRFKACLQPIICADGGLFIFSEHNEIWLPGSVYAAVAPMLDGAHKVEAIFAALSSTHPAEQVFAALDHLRTSGYLAEDVAAEGRATVAFWEHLGVLPTAARSRLDVTTVSTLACGQVDIEPLTDLLALQGIQVGQEGELTVVVTDDYLRPELAAWNNRALISGKAWLLVKPVGIETLIGPMFVPKETACWECLAQQLRGHRKLEQYVGRRSGRTAIPPVAAISASITSTVHAVLAEAATEITRWIGSGGQSPLLNQVVSTSVLTFERARHLLIRRPQCPSCGSFACDNSIAPKPPRLQSCLKVLTSDGGHRARDHQQVIEKLEQHLSPITGIISSLVPGERSARTDNTGKDLTPIFAADHIFCEIYDERFLLSEGLRRRSGGKGKSIEQARVSALAESLERYSGVFDGTEPRIRATFSELGGPAIHPNLCMGYSKQQYAQRQLHNRSGQKARCVPEPFREDVEIEWTPVWSLSTQEMRYLPTSFCYFGYHSSDPLFARADSNGCAAGSVIEEAVLQGLLELMERDAVALWWYNRLQRRGVDLNSVDDAYVSALRRHYRELRRELWALNVTSDIGVPTFAAISRRVDKAEEDIIYGFGAHLDPQIALSRALTEMNQALESVPTATGAESSLTYRGSRDAVHWWRTVKASDASYLMPNIESGPCRLQDFKNLSSDDLYQDVLTCVGLASIQAIEVLVLDQTRPDVNFPVIRVVAPGLRHFWPRFGPGRLYDVPLREGWLRRPLEECELNPFIVQM